MTHGEWIIENRRRVEEFRDDLLDARDVAVCWDLGPEFPPPYTQKSVYPRERDSAIKLIAELKERYKIGVSP